MGKTVQRNTEFSEVTAYHEAGHAVVAFNLGIHLLRRGVTIVGNADYDGAVWHSG